LSIIGFDDIFGSDFTSPAITTIHMPLHATGEQAMHQLIEAVNGRSDGDTADLTASLVVRGSTAASAK
jgi:LacI family transcriptional regulator